MIVKARLFELDRAANHAAVILEVGMPISVGEHHIRSAIRGPVPHRRRGARVPGMV